MSCKLLSLVVVALAIGTSVATVERSESTKRVVQQPRAAEVALVERGKAVTRTIVIPQTASPVERHAAEELVSFLEQTTGVKLPVVTDADPLPAGAILVGETKYSVALLGDPAFNPAKLGDDGFRIAVRDGKIVLFGSKKRGALFAVYELLERFAGCRWHSSWHSVIPKRDRVSLPANFDDTQTPAFVMRQPHFFDMDQHHEFAVRNKVNGFNANGKPVDAKLGGDPFRFGGGLGNCHTFYTLCPPAVYGKEHPEYFSLVKGKRVLKYGQLCLTNPDVLKLVTSNVLARIRKDPGAKFYGVSQNDWGNYCTCPQCAAVDAEEGSHAGTMVRFVNAIAAEVEKEFPDVFIETLAYQYTRKPPKKVRLRHNVVPCLCSIECEFAYPLNRSAYPPNRAFLRDLEGWKVQTDHLYIWDYATDFSHYTLPMGNVLALQDNVRIFRDNNAKMFFEQGSCQGNHGAFAELKAWLLAKWMWNPELPIEPLLDDFFNGYYGKGAPFVRQFFDELHRRQLEWSKDPKRPLRIYYGPNYGWFTDEFFEWAADLWAKAEAAVKDDPVVSYNVRMGAFGVDYARLERLRAAKRDIAKQRELAKSLLARFDEAKTSFTKLPIRLTNSNGARGVQIRKEWRRLLAEPAAKRP